MAHWLLKTEPSAYSYADLEHDKRTVWEGVSSAPALLHLRAVRAGDSVVVYHTGGEKSAVGLARVSRGAYPDPKLGDERRVVVDLVPVRAFASPVPLTAFRADAVLSGSELVRFTRLSVLPLTAAQHERVLELASGALGAAMPRTSAGATSRAAAPAAGRRGAARAKPRVS
jgi:predicted RNA-binding protein with PUA-like domain